MPFIIIIISFINCLKSKTPPNTLEKHYALLCHSNQILRKRNIFSRFFSRIQFFNYLSVVDGTAGSKYSLENYIWSMWNQPKWMNPINLVRNEAKKYANLANVTKDIRKVIYWA